MNKKRIAICILIVFLLLLLLGGAIALMQWKKEPAAKENGKKEEVIDQTIVIENIERTESFEKEEFTDKTTEKPAETDAEVLGGSEIVEIVRPTEDEKNENTEADSEIEWLPGIW